MFQNYELYLLQCCITALYCLVWSELVVNALCSVEQCQFEGLKRGLVHVEGNFDVLRWTGFHYNYVTLSLNASCVDLVPISFFHSWAHGEDTSNI